MTYKQCISALATYGHVDLTQAPSTRLRQVATCSSSFFTALSALCLCPFSVANPTSNYINGVQYVRYTFSVSRSASSLPDVQEQSSDSMLRLSPCDGQESTLRSEARRGILLNYMWYKRFKNSCFGMIGL